MSQSISQFSHDRCSKVQSKLDTMKRKAEEGIEQAGSREEGGDRNVKGVKRRATLPENSVVEGQASGEETIYKAFRNGLFDEDERAKVKREYAAAEP